jgi:exopolysaccharide biosynthesis polyprenyl glycosylphosphotransferase
LHLRRSERKVLLRVIDVFILNLALWIALVLRADYPVVANVILETLKWFVSLTLVWLICAHFYDCYDLARAASTFYSVRSAGLAALLTALTYVFVPFFTPALQSRSLIFLFGISAMAGVMTWRFVYAQVFVQPWFEQRALVIGSGDVAQQLVEILKPFTQDANPFRGTGYQIVGFIDDALPTQRQNVAGIPHLSGIENLVSMVKVLEVDEVIVAVDQDGQLTQQALDVLLLCREKGLRVVTLIAFYERLLMRVPVDHVGQDLPSVIPMQETAVERIHRIVKRLVDVSCAIPGILAVGLWIPIIAVVNFCTSRGPLFYRQARVGQGGRIFKIIKFRTMIPDAEQTTGAVWARNDDDRITWIGHFLRRTRLDELPQFVNILLGEMSLVGPRPERPEFVEQLAQELPFYRARHAVRPGITGWAQVKYHYGNTLEDAKIKLEYDLYYVKHLSFLLDLRIMLQTFPLMIQLAGM